MCAIVFIEGAEVNGIGELRQHWPTLVAACPAPEGEPDETDDDWCLCSIDLYASARLNGYELTGEDGVLFDAIRARGEK